jgi:DNA-binding SARP family transcriptional activator
MTTSVLPPGVPRWSVGVLGPIAVHRDGEPLRLGGHKQRALLTALARSAPGPVSVDQLVDLLWRGSPPATVTVTLQGYVCALRRVLEAERAPRTPARVLVSRGSGYALAVPADAYDSHRLEQAVHRSGEVLAALPVQLAPRASAVLVPRLQRLVTDLDAVLALWRGEPFADLGDAPEVWGMRHRLDELRLTAVEHRVVARLALGQHAAVVGELEELTDHFPLRETWWALRAVALSRCGRQAEALAAIADVRRLLADELGLDPGERLQRVHAAVLRQDPALSWSPPAPPAPVRLPRQRSDHGHQGGRRTLRRLDRPAIMVRCASCR